MMLLRISPKTSPLFTLLSKNSTTLFSCSRNIKSLSCKRPVIFAALGSKNHTPMAKRAAPYSTASAEAVLQKSAEMSPPMSNHLQKGAEISSKMSKKMRREAPEGILRRNLDQCSKRGDLTEALRLYYEARAANVPLNAHHFNVMLYLCSAKSDDMEPGEKVLERLEKGFEIFKQMAIDKVEPNEATFTNASRLAAMKNDPALAFSILKQMKDRDLSPKLRSYGPALFGFCEKRMADEAYEVDLHMLDNGVVAEEPELAALLKLSSEVQREGKVYEMVHRIRAAVRQVSEETATAIEEWFRSTRAAEVGAEKWDVELVKKRVVEGGGGWHGQGWLGKGNWKVLRTTMDEKGICNSCGEKLVSIDIDPRETENFERSLAALACKKEVRDNFMRFQNWLQRHGPFDAVVDGANVALANSHLFSFAQINRVVNELRSISPSNKQPLVILHQSRVYGGPAEKPNNKKLLESWKAAGALYATPRGSNDDWYWLYAAVNSKCFLVTNDKMRDHLFSLLGSSFFPRWQEKHQVRLKISEDGRLRLHMPPVYSNVIQESEQGNWHIPTVTDDDLEVPRQWICATRAKNA